MAGDSTTITSGNTSEISSNDTDTIVKGANMLEATVESSLISILKLALNKNAAKSDCIISAPGKQRFGDSQLKANLTKNNPGLGELGKMNTFGIGGKNIFGNSRGK